MYKIYELYDKTLLSIGNVHKITKFSQFRVDMRSWKGAWLRNGTRGYRKFGLKWFRPPAILGLSMFEFHNIIFLIILKLYIVQKKKDW